MINNISEFLPETITNVEDLAALENEKSNELGQNEFLDLMLAQLKNQDPFKPLENGEFVAQMAQFSTVSGIEEMNASLKGMTDSLQGNRLLEASNLIGRTALVTGNTATLTEDGLTAIYRLDNSATNVNVNVYSEAGEIMYQEHIAEKGLGQHEFKWDGRTTAGGSAPDGNYTVEVTYGNDQEKTTAETLVPSTIGSVSAISGGNELMLETVQGLRIALADIETLQ